MLNYRDGLADMPLYDTREQDWNIKVNANESNIGLPPLVEDRVMTRLSRIAFPRYPNEEYDLLCEQIGEAYGYRRENVIIGNGSSEIIEKVFYAFGGNREHRIVYPSPSFSMYAIYAAAADATGAPVPLRSDYQLDVEAFVQQVNQSRASLAVICNPNNPTGQILTAEEVEYISSHISCAFLVDEAYAEFCEHSVISLLNKYPHQLSGGEQQRVCIARAVIKKPTILFCDEATGALDSENSKNIIVLLHVIKQNYGTSILFTTHNREIARTADRILLLEDGRIVRDDMNMEKLSPDQMSWEI